MLYVLLSEQCRQAAREYGRQDALEELARKIQRDQAFDGLFDSVSRGIFWKKRIGRHHRLFAYSYPSGEDRLFIFCRFLLRSDIDYEKSLSLECLEEWEAFCSIPGKATLEKILHERKSQKEDLLLPKLSLEEETWLYSGCCGEHHALDDDLVVLETQEWIDAFTTKKESDYRVTYRQILENEILMKAIPKQSSQGGEEQMETEGQVYWVSRDDRGILFARSPGKILLLEPLKFQNEAALEERKAYFAHKIFSQPSSEHGFQQYAKRAYPAYASTDPDIWLEIEKDEEANLALSPEEAQLLQNIHAAEKEEESYPLFINGRAGSGKSTMLQYLMSDYLSKAIQDSPSLLPLYMTCSENLLAYAKKRIRRLLTTRIDNLMRRSSPESEEGASALEESLSRSFAVFRHFLLEALPQERSAFFSEEKLVDYASFRALWNKEVRHPKALRVGPELSWHTIRTYIKGRRPSLEEYFSPEQFEMLPQKSRSISMNTYREVWEHVWESWYKGRTNLEKEDFLWDDQDLAAEVLYGGYLTSKDRYAAIFCDEAQDFTSLELEVVVQLSRFSHKRILPEELRRVPFVFAGDPLQTLNPTGFRWEALQADFHEKFSALVEKQQRKETVKPNYKELNYNYRSNQGTVYFGNLISLFRTTLLGLRNTNPQEAWWPENKENPLWYDIDDPEVAQWLKERPDLVKIINCEEGEEALFAEEDPILKHTEKEANVFRNVFSPVRAKGLEFPDVVLYRFGEKSPQEFEKRIQELMKKDLESFQESEERLPFEYFLNRLYVAASRSKKRVYIVDTKKAWQEFWKFATSQELLDVMLELTKKEPAWGNRICAPLAGNIKSDEKGLRRDPAEQAAEYEEQGRQDRDPYSMHQAALAYRNVPDEEKALLCRALASEYERNFTAAGDLYEKIGKIEEAFRCYWRGKNYKALRDLGVRHAFDGKELELRGADMMIRAGQNKGTLGTFPRDLNEAAEEPNWMDKVLGDDTWREVLSHLAQHLCALKEQQQERHLWRAASDLFEKLVSQGYGDIGFNSRGALAKRAGKPELAAKLWEQGGNTGTEEYYRIKAGLERYPANLPWLWKYRNSGEMLSQWKEHGHGDPGELSSEIVSVLFEAALTEGELALAANCLHEHPRDEGAERLMFAALEANQPGIVVDGAAATMRQMVSRGEWGRGLNLLRSLTYSRRGGEEFQEVFGDITFTLQSMEGVQEALFEAFCGEMLRFSGGFNGTKNDRDMVAEYLEQQLLNPWKEGHRRHPNIPAQSLGGALERVSRHVEILEFYDKGLKKELFYEHERTFAEQRHIRGLENFASYLEGRARKERIPEERDRLLMEASKRRERVFSLRQEANIGNKALPEFAPPPAASQRIRLYAATPQEEVEEAKERKRDEKMESCTFAPFNILYSPDKTKMRIENTDLFETVTLNFAQHTLLGDAHIENAPLREGILAAWIMPQWDAVISLQKDFAEILNRKTGKAKQFCGEIPKIFLGDVSSGGSSEGSGEVSGEITGEGTREEKVSLFGGMEKGSFSFPEGVSKEAHLTSERADQGEEAGPHKDSLKNKQAPLPSFFTNLSGNGTGNGGTKKSKDSLS